MSPSALYRPMPSIKRLLRSAALPVGLASLIASGFGLLRESAVASTLGLGIELDALATSLSLVLFVGSAIASTVSSGLLTEMVLLESSDHRRSDAFVLRAVLLSLLVGLALGVGIHAYAPLIADAIYGVPEARDAMTSTLRGFAIVCTAALAGRGCLAAALQSRGRFVAPAAVPVVSSALLAGAAIALADPTPRILGFWFSIGVVAEVAVLAARLIASTRRRPAPTTTAAPTAAVVVWRRLGAGLAAAAVFGAGPFIDLAVAGWYRSGAAGALSLAGRIPLAVGALLVAAIVTPLYTELAAAEVAGDGQRFHAVVRRSLRRLFVIGSGTAAVIAVAGFAVARLLFAQGELDVDDAMAIARTQAVYSLVMPPFAAGVLLSRALLAMNRQGAVLLVGLVGAGVNVLLDVLLVRVFGVNGIALATVLVYSLTMTLMLGLLRRRTTLAG